MSKSLGLGAAGIALGLLLVATASVAAEERTSAGVRLPTPIPMGTYERFTVLQKIRFGATALVNPSVAENAAVVYSFEPDEVLATAGWYREVSDQISAGRVQFGHMVASGAKTVLKVDEKTIQDIGGTMRQTSSLPYTPKGGKFLSMHPTLGGARPSGEWIAWWPEEAKK